MSLEDGLKALEEGRYADAIKSLEPISQSAPIDKYSQEPTQAKMWLAIAYHRIGDGQKVLNLCNQLVNSPSADVSHWAQQWLNSIIVATYTPEYLEEILAKGHQALREKKYPEAIRLLEEYCQQALDVRSMEYKEAQMWLVQAYRGNRQLEGAISICQELEVADDTIIRQWAKETNPSLKVARKRLKHTLSSIDSTILESPAQEKLTEKPKKVVEEKILEESTPEQLTSETKHSEEQLASETQPSEKLEKKPLLAKIWGFVKSVLKDK